MLMNSVSRGCAAAATAVMILSFPAAAQEAGSALPGGASSLQENYQDWTLACQSTPQRVCIVSHQQLQQNGQRVLAVELRRKGDGALSGNLLLPFGLMLDAGAALQIDDKAAQNPLRFSTCLPVGCVVPLDFDSKTIATLRAGTILKVKGKTIEPKDATFSVSLKGLGAAIDRLEALKGK